LRQRAEQINKIFDALDSDHDGKICQISIALNRVHPKIVKMFSPIINQMYSESIDIDKQTFLRMSLNLYSVLTPEDKNLILMFGKEKKSRNIPEFSFTPRTNSIKKV
jgi:hypothetical protein